jgi:hypothetical protein
MASTALPLKPAREMRILTGSPGIKRGINQSTVTAAKNVRR